MLLFFANDCSTSSGIITAQAAENYVGEGQGEECATQKKHHPRRPFPTPFKDKSVAGRKKRKRKKKKQGECD